MIEWILLILAGAIGLVVSAKDFKQGVIKNKYIALLLLLGIAFQFFSGPEAMQFLSIVAYGLAIAFMLWYIGIWPAGDAKLFFAFLWFFPPAHYSSIAVIMAFVVNIFVPIFFFMFFVILYRSKLKVLVEALRYAFKPYNVLMLAVVYFGFVWIVMRLIQMVIAIQMDYFMMVLILFITFETLLRVLSAKMEYLFYACAFLRVILDYKSVYSIGFLWEFVMTILLFLFFRFFILYLAFKLYTKKVPIKKLKAGMSPAENIARKGKNFEKTSFLQASLISFMSSRGEKSIHNLNHYSKKDVEKIKKLRKEGKIPFASVLVNQTQPFALFILFGFILTYAFGTDFISFLLSLT